jgi:histidinol phosphatase-like PHP family hydrolase
VPPDPNALIASLLRDLAFAESSPQKMYGYKRAAAVVFDLPKPIDTYFRPDGSMEKITGLGPASTRVIREVMETGGSPTVERAVESSARREDVLRRRTLRGGVLSRAEVERVLADRSLQGPRRADYRGDLQVHSEWSDGVPTLRDLARAGAARAYEFIGVTDHSRGLPIAGGLSVDEVARQHAEIDDLNRRAEYPCRILKGIEANIAADGGLDLTAEEIAAFEIVLAAPHAKLRRLEDQTARMLAAVATPGIHILAHPRGRISGSRGGVLADWDRVFEAAAGAGVAVEIDGDPARQDLDAALARRALGAGCLFALDSDAHTTDQLAYADTALAHARLAAIPRDRIVNCWPLARLLEWLTDRAARPRRRKSATSTR